MCVCVCVCMWCVCGVCVCVCVQCLVNGQGYVKAKHKSANHKENAEFTVLVTRHFMFEGVVVVVVGGGGGGGGVKGLS